VASLAESTNTREKRGNGGMWKRGRGERERVGVTWQDGAWDDEEKGKEGSTGMRNTMREKERESKREFVRERE
jgi:hypothetical protein